MQEAPGSPDPEFVVDWQLADEAGAVIDLSVAEAEMVMPDDSSVRGAASPR
jgi:hypothetical protein